MYALSGATLANTNVYALSGATFALLVSPARAVLKVQAGICWSGEKYLGYLDCPLRQAFGFGLDDGDGETTACLAENDGTGNCPIFESTAAVSGSGMNGAVSEWDTSLVTDMSRLFGESRSNFNQELRNWDTSRVTRMNRLFYWSMDFQSDLSRWDVSAVTDMRHMFDAAIAFNSDLSVRLMIHGFIVFLFAQLVAHSTPPTPTPLPHIHRNGTLAT